MDRFKPAYGQHSSSRQPARPKISTGSFIRALAIRMGDEERCRQFGIVLVIETGNNDSTTSHCFHTIAAIHQFVQYISSTACSDLVTKPPFSNVNSRGRPLHSGALLGATEPCLLERTPRNCGWLCARASGESHCSGLWKFSR